MKKLFIFFVLLSISQIVEAQSIPPQYFNYQAVVRNNRNELVPNQKVQVEFKISKLNGIFLSEIYKESQITTSNAVGIIELKIGKGTRSTVADFASIPWSDSLVYEVVIKNGSNLLEILASSPTPESFASNPYSILARRALKADTAAVALKSINEAWTASGSNVFRANGNVGIGVQNPSAKLEVGEKIQISYFPPDDLTQGNAGLTLSNRAKGGGKYAWSFLSASTGGGFGIKPNAFEIWEYPSGVIGDLCCKPRFRILPSFESSDYKPVVIDNKGNLGLGIESPNQKLDVNGTGRFSKEGPALQLEGQKHTYIEFYPKGVSNGRRGYIGYPCDVCSNLDIVNIEGQPITLQTSSASGNVGIGTNNPTSKLDVNGTVSVSVLEIRGGGDITEKANNTEGVQAGEVVVIDPTQSNHVKRSQKAYDKTVLGVVSGAGGVSHGMQLAKAGVLDGNTPFAIAGRVYVKVTGKVEIGDLLTTSDKEGCAMTAKYGKKAFGAVIGKALSVPNAEGLVLMLVMMR